MENKLFRWTIKIMKYHMPGDVRTSFWELLLFRGRRHQLAEWAWQAVSDLFGHCTRTSTWVSTILRHS